MYTRPIQGPRQKPFDLNPEQSYILFSHNLKDVQVLDDLLRKGFQPHLYDNELIIVAGSKGRLAIVERLLLDPRVNPADRRGEIARHAYMTNHPDVLMRVLQIPSVRAEIDPATMYVYMRYLENVVKMGYPLNMTGSDVQARQPTLPPRQLSPRPTSQQFARPPIRSPSQRPTRPFTEPPSQRPPIRPPFRSPSHQPLITSLSQRLLTRPLSQRPLTRPLPRQFSPRPV